ncbi:MAG TPA: TlpA disulfide reductase family protein [Chitinophagaceae bacterium]|nr:TlpA disulfide reductase family protein [Chitinophagaceae bacterium]
MQLYFRLLITFCLINIVAYTQKFSNSLVNIGDPAPPLRVQHWIKGTPFNEFEKEKIYVVEFWATWCRPCKAGMPLLSALARKYRDNVIVLGIDIFETKTTTLDKIKSFVDSMGGHMDYSVAVADSNYMEHDWLSATGEINMGIPRAFIVDRDGRLAWMGHPCDNFEDALFKIVNNTWDISEALAKRNLEFRLRKLDDSLTEVLEFAPNGNFRSDSWKKDSALVLIDEIAKTEPLVKYTPRIAYQIFSFLLKTNMKMAYEYGKKVIETTTYEKPAGFIIIGAIEDFSKEITLMQEIYKLGIEAIQVELNEALSCFPEIRNIYKRYYKMSEWYWLINNKSKAIETLERAIETLKREKDFSEIDLTEFESRLREYKRI